MSADTEAEIDRMMRYRMLALFFSFMEKNPRWWKLLEDAVTAGLEFGLWKGSRRAFVARVEQVFMGLGQMEAGRQLLEVLNPDDAEPLTITGVLAKQFMHVDTDALMAKFLPLRAQFAPQVRRTCSPVAGTGPRSAPVISATGSSDRRCEWP